MKIMKEGNIEGCCEESKNTIWYFEKEGENVVLVDEDGYYVFPNLIHNYYVKFCPFCGAKTEVEK